MPAEVCPVGAGHPALPARAPGQSARDAPAPAGGRPGLRSARLLAVPVPTPVPTPAARRAWRAAVLVLVLLGTFFLAAATTTTVASAANVTLAQCNGQNATALGATVEITCAVSIVNTISSGGITSSTVTVTRTCLLGPCAPGNGTTTTTSSDLVTRVEQCNGSGNDAAAPITCTVDIINNISEDTPGAAPVDDGTVNQCVGSARGGGGTEICDPTPANTTGATVTQCNVSGNGGGGTVACTIGPQLRISPAIPVTVDQCNRTGTRAGAR